ncbi:FxsA family protein [Magnetospirillum sp. UT-4]|uniref:FxsA family protein n=1 Tax=Magnetospirillum sp. UT-4 TaxID=2681467 RepID=UPI00137CA8D9|nr:FxsA family protein [Magnetospirillum sp. UT-4]CAA7621926.1 conserved membrane hypothetical protein [Magnetospirillum sp. UT-4]
MAWMVLLAVIAVPVIEIALFVKSAQLIGVLPTVLLAVGAGIAGIALVRLQGLGLLWRTRSQLDRGELPMAEVFDAVCLALAGGLLLLPGFLSDVVALALLLPPVRLLLRQWLGSRLVTVQAGGTPQRAPDPPVIEGEYRVVDDKGPKP